MLRFFYIFVYSVSVLAVLRYKFFDIRVLRGENHESHSKQCIRTCCEYFQRLVEILDLEYRVRAGALAYPVLLHGLDFFRPSRKIIEIFKQFVSVIRDLQAPLRESLFAYRALASFAFSIYYLFISEHSFTSRAPVDLSLFFIRETFVVELDEDVLHPLIILRIAGLYFPVPVI